MLLALTLVALTPAFAGDKEALGDAWWTGPLQTPNAGTIPKNHWYVETYFVAEQDNGVYGNSGTKYGANSKQANALGMPGYDNNFQSVTLMTYGVTNKFNFQILTDFGGIQGGTVCTLPTDALIGISASTCSESGCPTSCTATSRVSRGRRSRLFPKSTFRSSPAHTQSMTPGVGFWAIRPFWMPNGRILRHPRQ